MDQSKVEDYPPGAVYIEPYPAPPYLIIVTNSPSLIPFPQVS